MSHYDNSAVTLKAKLLICKTPALFTPQSLFAMSSAGKILDSQLMRVHIRLHTPAYWRLLSRKDRRKRFRQYRKMASRLLNSHTK